MRSDSPDSSQKKNSASYGFVADDAVGCALQRIGEAALRKDVNVAINEALKLARLCRADGGKQTDG